MARRCKKELKKLLKNPPTEFNIKVLNDNIKITQNTLNYYTNED